MVKLGANSWRSKNEALALNLLLKLDEFWSNVSRWWFLVICSGCQTHLQNVVTLTPPTLSTGRACQEVSVIWLIIDFGFPDKLCPTQVDNTLPIWQHTANTYLTTLTPKCKFKCDNLLQIEFPLGCQWLRLTWRGWLEFKWFFGFGVRWLGFRFRV